MVSNLKQNENLLQTKGIAIFCFSRGWGGLEMSALKVFNWLNERNYKAILLCVKNSKLNETAISTNFKEYVYSVNYPHYFNLLAYYQIYKILKENNISIVQTYKSSDIYSAVISGKLFGGLKKNGKIKPTIIHHLQMLPSTNRTDFIHRWLYSHLDKIITITNECSEAVAEKWQIPKSKIKMIYYGISPKDFNRDNLSLEQINSIKKKFNLPTDKKIISILGQITEGKGQRLLLEAFAELTKNREDCILTIVGRPPIGQDFFLEELKNYAQLQKINDKVFFLGFCENPQYLLKITDIFVMASYNETFGWVVIEALAAGCITIGSNAGGVREIIEHNKNGFLFETKSKQSLLENLQIALALNDLQKKEILKSAQETINAKFTVEKFINELTKLYNEFNFY